jgi:amino-acid N-acetyltransferase
LAAVDGVFFTVQRSNCRNSKLAPLSGTHHCFKGRQVIGFAAVEIYSSKLAGIPCLAVTPGWQHQGVGKELVRCCVAEAGRQNMLEVMAISARDEFLISCGFDYLLPGQKRALFIQARRD